VDSVDDGMLDTGDGEKDGMVVVVGTDKEDTEDSDDTDEKPPMVQRESERFSIWKGARVRATAPFDSRLDCTNLQILQTKS